MASAIFARTAPQRERNPAPVVEAVPARPGSRLVKALLLLAAFSVVVALAGRHYGGQIRLGGNTASTRTHEIVIANAVFHVPENLIRFKDQRVGGVTQRLDLFALWPDMSGYTVASREMFEAREGIRPAVIFLTLEPQQMSRDMSGRLEPIYRQLVEAAPDAEAVPGLAPHRFKAEHAIFSNEILHVETAGGAAPFVARCITGDEARAALAPCERDLLLASDGVSIKYRFPAHLLADHAALDAAVMRLVSGFTPEN